MSQIKERLRQPDRSTAPASALSKEIKTDLPAEDLATGLQGETIENDHGRIILIKFKQPMTELYGRADFSKHAGISGETLHIAAKKRVSAHFNLADALFIDTETTGLAGFSGTYAFLVGLGFIEDDHYCVEQIFMPRMSDEAALLHYLEEKLDSRRGIVSFNGKAYDIPLLTARYVQNRYPTRIDMHEHFDVLHAVRRLWQNDFGSCSLTTLEQHLLGIDRQGDIPGERIPAIYMDFLRTGELGELPQVLYHNKMDMLTLFALAIAAAENIAGAEHNNQPVQSTPPAARVAKLHFAAQSYARASELYTALAEMHDLPAEQRVQHLLELAATQKRMGNYDAAIASWEAALAQGKFSLDACLELAKAYEHKRKDLSKAIHYAERALGVVELRVQMDESAAHVAELEKLNHRLRRLRRKLDQSS